MGLTGNLYAMIAASDTVGSCYLLHVVAKKL
jgi:hypothetical protein